VFSQHPPPTPEQHPSTPEEASRAADLAAAEAATEADNPNPPSEKPILPSKRSKRSKSTKHSPSSEATATSDPISTPKASSDTSSEPKKKKKARWSDEMKAVHAAARAAQAASQAALGSTVPARAKKPESSTDVLDSPDQSTAPLAAPRYTISRSSSRNLPIYTDFKRGGNLRTTQIRKITGDLSALRDELRVLLKKEDHEVRINTLTQQINIKGHHKGQIEQFFLKKGF
jgi:large subunit ribosomal protein L49